MKIPKGPFRIVCTSLSHRQMLIRSTDEETRKNFDILIENVEYINLPIKFDIYKLNVTVLEGRPGVKFCFTDELERNYVIGSKFSVQENNVDIDESTIPIHQESAEDVERMLELIRKGQYNPKSQKENSYNWIRIYPE